MFDPDRVDLPRVVMLVIVGVVVGVIAAAVWLFVNLVKGSGGG